MALTLTELLGAGNFAAVGQTTGGAAKILIPPVAVYDAGGVAVIAWILDRYRQAQVADTTAPVSITRQVRETNNKIVMIYTVTLECDAADITDDFATSVDDNFT